MAAELGLLADVNISAALACSRSSPMWSRNLPCVMSPPTPFFTSPSRIPRFAASAAARSRPAKRSLTPTEGNVIWSTHPLSGAALDAVYAGNKSSYSDAPLARPAPPAPPAPPDKVAAREPRGRRRELVDLDASRMPPDLVFGMLK